MQTRTPPVAGSSGPEAPGGPPWLTAALIVGVGLLVFFVFLAQMRSLLGRPEPALPEPTPAPTVVAVLAPTAAPTSMPAVARPPAEVPTVVLRPVHTAT